MTVAEIERWRKKRRYYHSEIERLLRSIVRPGISVLDVGTGLGDSLAAVRPANGVGIDLSPDMIAVARKRHPAHEFRIADISTFETDDTFDAILMVNVVGELDDIWTAFRKARGVPGRDQRFVIVYYNYLWEPILKVGEALGLRRRQPSQNWFPVPDIRNLLELNGWEPLRWGHRCLLPVNIPILARFLNNFVAPLPIFRNLGLISFVVARPDPEPPRPREQYSVTVIVPCRNEAGNIEELVRRVPSMGRHTEILFVDGASNDGTLDRIKDVAAAYRGIKDVRWIEQGEARGKKDAVIKGFDAAGGDILMILDADITVMPEDLPKFYLALAEGKGEFVNGTRLVYAMEPGAMRTLNLIANYLFARGFSFLFSTRIRDTLCGTKVLFSRDWRKMRACTVASNDPFGDFDLLMYAARMGLKIVEIPVRYQERVYGTTKIRRFRHGWILLKRFLRGMREHLFGGPLDEFR